MGLRFMGQVFRLSGLGLGAEGGGRRALRVGSGVRVQDARVEARAYACACACVSSHACVRGRFFKFGAWVGTLF
jgi:hypothetical protein